MSAVSADEATERALTTVAKGAGIALSGRVAGAGLAYAFSVLIGRWLGAQAFGVFSLAFTIALLGMTAGRLGLGDTMLRFVALYRGEGALGKAKGTARFGVLLSLAGSLVLSVVLFCSADLLAVHAFGKPELGWVLRGLAWMIPAGNVGFVALAATQACGVMTYMALTTGIIAPVLQLVLAAVLMELGAGLSGAVIGTVAGQVAAAVLGYHFLGRVMPELRDRRIPAQMERARLVAFAGPMTALELTSNLMSWIDILLLGLYVSAHDLGLYSAAARTAALTSFILLGVNALFAPTMADLFNRGEMVILERLFKTITKWVVAIALPVFLLCALRGCEILALFGPDFPAAAVPLALLAAGQLVNASTGSVGYMLTMSGRQSLALADQIGALALAVVLNLWLIPPWGVLGAAVAVSGTTALVNLLRLIQVAWLLRIHPYEAGLLRPVAAATGAVVLTTALTRLAAPLSDPLLLALWLFTFATGYGTLLIVLGLSREDRMLWLKVRAGLGFEAQS